VCPVPACQLSACCMQHNVCMQHAYVCYLFCRSLSTCQPSSTRTVAPACSYNMLTRPLHTHGPIDNC
jgi:hypothetical protein